MSKRSKPVKIKLDKITLPEVTDLEIENYHSDLGLDRRSDIKINGIFDDGITNLLGNSSTKIRKLTIRRGHKKFTVPVVVINTFLEGKKRKKSTVSVTLRPMGPMVVSSKKRSKSKWQD